MMPKGERICLNPGNKCIQIPSPYCMNIHGAPLRSKGIFVNPPNARELYYANLVISKWKQDTKVYCKIFEANKRDSDHNWAVHQ